MDWNGGQFSRQIDNSSSPTVRPESLPSYHVFMADPEDGIRSPCLCKDSDVNRVLQAERGNDSNVPTCECESKEPCQSCCIAVDDDNSLAPQASSNFGSSLDAVLRLRSEAFDFASIKTPVIEAKRAKQSMPLPIPTASPVTQPPNYPHATANKISPTTAKNPYDKMLRWISQPPAEEPFPLLARTECSDLHGNDEMRSEESANSRDGERTLVMTAMAIAEGEQGHL